MNSPWAVGYKHGPSAHQYDTAQHDVISLWAYRSCQTTQVDLVRSDLVRFLSVKCQSCTLVRKDRVNISHWTPLICVWVFWSEKEGKALSHMGKWQALYWIYILTHFSQRDAREVLRSSPWKGIRVIRISPSFFSHKYGWSPFLVKAAKIFVLWSTFFVKAPTPILLHAKRTLDLLDSSIYNY